MDCFIVCSMNFYICEGRGNSGGLRHGILILGIFHGLQKSIKLKNSVTFFSKLRLNFKNLRYNGVFKEKIDVIH